MMSLALLADALKAPLVGRDVRFTGVSTDTRALKPGDLFVALVGPRFDGHSFLAEAISGGATGALLSREMDTALPHVRVPDTRRALGTFAAFWRMQFHIPLVAVTGSNGKTTTKDMVAAILARRGPVCATRGNLNNDIGVPLTLLRLNAEDRSAVIEMGMNHFGEIDYLTHLAYPTVAVITNASEAHLAGVGTLEGVARAKGEIFAGLASDGAAVINADDAFAGLWRKLAGDRRIVTFGLERAADVSAEWQPDARGAQVEMRTPAGSIVLQLSLLGRHNVLNAAAAAAAAMAAGAAASDVKEGLESVRPVPGRLELKPGVSGARVIDDTYNANPASAAASLQVLKGYKGERVLVLGDMGELGDQAPAMHARIGEQAREVGIQRLFVLGALAAAAVERFGKGARAFESPEALIDALLDCMHSDMSVLVKGSRAARMERVVAGIVRGSAATVTKEA